MNYFCHKLSDVQSKFIGNDTKIWQFTVVLKNAKIGKNCNLNAHVFIENDVKIGDNVTIKSGVQIWDGITIENDAFVGPNVTFTNDLLPRSKKFPENFLKTVIKKGASIGANATIIGGNIIGEYAMIGAGSVITKSVGKYQLMIGNPARHVGFVSNEGVVLDLDMVSKKGIKYEWRNNIIRKIND